MKALIIENSRLYRQLLDNIFGEQGFESDITDELRIAFDHLTNVNYDIICLNEKLKDGSGIDFARQCKRDSRFKHIPILFFTSDTDIQAQLEGYEVDEIIYKKNLQQITDQITHFVENNLDPIFSEGRVLFIEDSPSVAMVIKAALHSAGLKVDFFSSAEEAWSDFSNEASFGSDTEAYDLVITDINVEGSIDGLQLTSLIRKMDDARGYIPIIAITADNSPELRLSLYKEGINDLVPKPIMTEELLVRVSNLITNKKLLDKVHDQKRDLFAMATTDRLTGCHNRHSLMDFSPKFIAQAKRHKYPISLMVIDLDHFKHVNDTYGHAVGDIVLEEMGKLLISNFRDGDMVSRFGGEEFVVLLHHCDLKNAVIQADKLRQKVESLKPHDLVVTSSIGVTGLAVGEEHDFEALFAFADQGVYLAKENGRNRVESFVEADKD